MKTHTKIIIAALSFMLFVVSSTDLLHAQQRGGGRRGGMPGSGGPGPGGGPPRMMLPPEFDNRPFDITLQQLPPQYLGCDGELAYTRIKNGQENSKRGEIAAISKYQEKTDQGPRLPLLPTLDLESTYAFRVFPEWLYNAHDQILKVYCPLTAVLQNGKEDQSRKGLRVKYVPRVDNRQVVTNAYGKKVEFEELKFREYLIAFANFREFTVERVALPSATEAAGKAKKGSGSAGPDEESMRRETITGNIKVTPAEAEQLQERVAVIAVCKLVDPYVTSDTVEQKPTPEKPRDYLAQYYYLDVRLLELWFYDFDTGKVLMKTKAQQTSRLPNALIVLARLLRSGTCKHGQ